MSAGEPDRDEVLLEADWNREAAEMVEEVIRTQKQVAELLSNHNSATCELQAMKESCTQELAELQSDAWKLQLYAELDRMRSQLEMLAPLTQDNCSCPDDDAPATADSSESKQTLGAEAVPKAGQAADGNHGPFQQDEDELQKLDQEIAAINAQIAGAKEEMASMMQLKTDLEAELAAGQPEEGE